MTDTDLQNLTTRFYEFRTALEIFPKKGLLLPFDDFPFGTCGDASLLLAKYFENCGLGNFRYISGTIRENGSFQSHAWLEKDGLIIDITADQFEEFDEPVIIEHGENSWYRRFESEEEVSDFNLHTDWSRGALASVYRRVIEYVSLVDDTIKIIKV